MSDELLLKEIEDLRKEKEALVVSKRSDSLVFAGLSTATIITASLQLWYGLAAAGVVWLFLWLKNNSNKPKPPPAKETGVYIVQCDGSYDYGVYVELDNGTKKKVTGNFVTYQLAVHQMNWIREQKAK
jgi:hypothetical protein